MPSTAQQLGSFQDPYNYSTPGTQKDHDLYSPFMPDGSDVPYNPNAFGAKISDWLGITDYQREYDQYLKKDERDYERASINSARAWEEYLDSTKFQRAKADLEKAGFNPWLALQSGVSGSAAGSSTSTGGSTSKANIKGTGSSKSNLAVGLVAVAKILSILLA